MPRRTKEELRNFARPLRLSSRSIRLNVPEYVRRSLHINPGDRLTWSMKAGIPRFQVGSGPNKFFLQAFSLYCTFPMNLAKSAEYWDSDWVKLDIIQKDPVVISLPRTTPPPAPKSVRKIWKKKDYDWKWMNKELDAMKERNQRLEDANKRMNGEIRHLKAVIDVYNTRGQYPKSWWIDLFRRKGLPRDYILGVKQVQMFGSEWWLNPYFIVFGSDLGIIDIPWEIDTWLAGRLADYDLDDPDIDPVEAKAYRPVLEMVKSGMSLAGALAASKAQP